MLPDPPPSHSLANRSSFQVILCSKPGFSSIAQRRSQKQQSPDPPPRKQPTTGLMTESSPGLMSDTRSTTTAQDSDAIVQAAKFAQNLSARGQAEIRSTCPPHISYEGKN